MVVRLSFQPYYLMYFSVFTLLSSFAFHLWLTLPFIFPHLLYCSCSPIFVRFLFQPYSLFFYIFYSPSSFVFHSSLTLPFVFPCLSFCPCSPILVRLSCQPYSLFCFSTSFILPSLSRLRSSFIPALLSLWFSTFFILPSLSHRRSSFIPALLSFFFPYLSFCFYSPIFVRLLFQPYSPFCFSTSFILSLLSNLRSSFTPALLSLLVFICVCLQSF